MPVSISKLPEITNIKDDSFIMLTQDGKTKRTLCNQFVTEEEARLDEFSPVITTSKSMTSVGQGDNGDYSSSIHEGAFKDCMLHGRTLVNYNQEGHNRNEYVVPSAHEGQHITATNTIEGHVKSAILKGNTLVNLIPKGSHSQFDVNNIYGGGMGFWEQTEHHYTIKPSTKYLVIVNVTFNSGSKIVVNNNEGSIACFKDSLYVEPNEVGCFKWIVTSRDDLSNCTTILRSYTAGVGQVIGTMQVLEYQEGMENWDIPYFEGMTSVKMPVLTTTGKNLLDTESLVEGSYWSATGHVTKYEKAMLSKQYIRVKPSTRIYFSYSNVQVLSYDINKKFINRTQSNAIPYLVTDGVAFIRLSFYNTETYDKNIMVTMDETPSPYVPFKSNILTVNEEVKLRGIGDVKDELNLLTGELTQRIGEIVLDGSDDENWLFYQGENSTVTSFYLDDMLTNVKLVINPTIHQGSRLSQLPITNYLPAKEPQIYRFDDENCFISSSKKVNINVSNSKATTVDSLKAYLNSNPLIIQYQLETPTVKTVDLSDNVVYSYDEVTHYDCSSESGSLVPTLSIKNEVSYKTIIKPSTKYSVVFNRTKIGESLRVNLGGTEVGVSTSVVGKNIVSVTTQSTLSHELVKFIGVGNTIKDVQVIEGDITGDEPYFEGMIDCKSPILSNIGKNILNPLINFPLTIVKGGGMEKNDGQLIAVVPVKPNTTYIMSSSRSANKGRIVAKMSNRILKKDELIGSTFSQSSVYNFLRDNYANGRAFEKQILDNTEILFTTLEDCYYLYVNIDGAWDMKTNESVEINWIQIEEASSKSEYLLHKSNTTTFNQKDDKTIVLRSLPNGVCDTLNVETGEYVQRIGEVVLDGSENWSQGGTQSSGLVRFYAPPADKKHTVANVMSSDIAPYNGITPYGVVGYENVTGYSHNIHLNINVKMERIGATDIAETKQNISLFQQWLSQNPITVQYELETPIIKIVDIQGFPYAYEDGHVIVSSGSNEPSITPKVQYSVPTNRGAQITQNTKSLIRQGKLLDDIEGKINQIIEATINDSIMLMKLRNK